MIHIKIYYKMEISKTIKYLIDIIIFVAVPFIIYVSFSFYFWHKINQFKKIHKSAQSVKMPSELKYIVKTCYVYIALNLFTGLFSCALTILFRDQIQPRVQLFSKEPATVSSSFPDSVRGISAMNGK